MKLKNNFQRNLVFYLFSVLNSLILGVIFIIYRVYFKLPFLAILIFFILSMIFYHSEPFDITKKIFKKYCNKKCRGCSMWHCDFHYEDGKFVR